MIKTLKKAFEIDITTWFNSFVYTVKHNSLLKHIFKKDYYNRKALKKFIRVMTLIFACLKAIIFRLLYVGIIIFILERLHLSIYFKEVFILLSIIGMFINTNTLHSSIKKYYNVILLGMDAIDYTKANLFYAFFKNLFLNIIAISVFYNLIGIDLLTTILISLISVSVKLTGEYIGILYYKRNDKTIFSKTSLLLFISLIVFLLLGVIILLKIRFNLLSLIIATIILLFLALISYIKISKEEKIIYFYKKINNESSIMEQDDGILSTRELAVEIRKKDYKIDPKKLKNKHGYNYFNTIFFERHKAILRRSAIYFTIFICLFFTGVLLVFAFTNEYDKVISDITIGAMPALLFIMYFINRGSIITEAMFINCDHYMLTFNFYREPSVILNVFKQRLKTVTKVNLLPAVALGIGYIILLIFINSKMTILEYCLLFIAIISISIFFSVHYLVIYYLLQPYDINLKMKSISYSIVSFLTYFICYEIMQYHFAPLNFSLMVIIATILYIIVALVLVYKKAWQTFRLK